MNSLVGDHQVAVVDVDEGVLEGSDMFGTNLYGFLVTIDQLACRGTRLRLSTSMGDMKVVSSVFPLFYNFTNPSGGGSLLLP